MENRLMDFSCPGEPVALFATTSNNLSVSWTIRNDGSQVSRTLQPDERLVITALSISVASFSDEDFVGAVFCDTNGNGIPTDSEIMLSFGLQNTVITPIVISCLKGVTPKIGTIQGIGNSYIVATGTGYIIKG